MSKAADMAQAVNNLRLKIMKAPWLTVSTEYCKTQELFKAITVVQTNLHISNETHTAKSMCIVLFKKATVLE